MPGVLHTLHVLYVWRTDGRTDTQTNRDVKKSDCRRLLWMTTLKSFTGSTCIRNAFLTLCTDLTWQLEYPTGESREWRYVAQYHLFFLLFFFIKKHHHVGNKTKKEKERGGGVKMSLTERMSTRATKMICQLRLRNDRRNDACTAVAV